MPQQTSDNTQVQPGTGDPLQTEAYVDDIDEIVKKTVVVRPAFGVRHMKPKLVSEVDPLPVRDEIVVGLLREIIVLLREIVSLLQGRR